MVVREVMLEGKLTRVKQEKKSIHLHFIWSPCISSSLEHFLWHLIGHPRQKKRKQKQRYFLPTFTLSSLFVSTNDHSGFYSGASIRTRDLSRLTVTYFSSGHFSKMSKHLDLLLNSLGAILLTPRYSCLLVVIPKCYPIPTAIKLPVIKEL